MGLIQPFVTPVVQPPGQFRQNSCHRATAAIQLRSQADTDVVKNNSVSLVDCIGNTPLIRLNSLSEQSGCEILGKAEFMNPGGSVKDRAALGMIRAGNSLR